MSEMVDPHRGLLSYQQALLDRTIAPKPAKYETGLLKLVDRENGVRRVTHALVEGRVVKEMAVFVRADPYEGEGCFQVGYAGAEKFRGQGVGVDVLTRSIDDLRRNLRLPVFYVEAIIDSTNIASLRVCEKVLSTTPVQVTERPSGNSVLNYVKRVEMDITKERSASSVSGLTLIALGCVAVAAALWFVWH